MVRPVVHSTKHYVQTSLATVAAGTILSVTASNGVAVQNKDNSQEVEEGSTVKALYVELWVRSGEITPGTFIFIIEKRPAGHAAPSTAEMAALHDYDNKRNVLYTTQGLTNDANADAIAVYRAWIKIPKGKQRQGLGDRLAWSIFAQGAIDLHVCGFMTYKEYS